MNKKNVRLSISSILLLVSSCNNGSSSYSTPVCSGNTPYLVLNISDNVYNSPISEDYSGNFALGMYQTSPVISCTVPEGDRANITITPTGSASAIPFTYNSASFGTSYGAYSNQNVNIPNNNGYVVTMQYSNQSYSANIQELPYLYTSTVSSVNCSSTLGKVSTCSIPTTKDQPLNNSSQINYYISGSSYNCKGSILSSVNNLDTVSFTACNIPINKSSAIASVATGNITNYSSVSAGFNLQATYSINSSTMNVNVN